VSSLDDFRKQAKRWLEDVRRRNPGSVKRLRLAHPNAPASPVLRDIQHALAREQGYADWKALKTALEQQAVPAAPEWDDFGAIATHDDRVATFLRYACCSDYVQGRGDQVRLPAAAARLLRANPEIAGDSVYTAVVCGDVTEVASRVTNDLGLVNRKGGPRNWEPILYLCYGRLPLDGARDNAVAMAKLLLDRGANANAYFMRGHALLSTLVGVVGEGEQESTPHPHRESLYRLLLEYGAELYDIQVLYNTHFTGDMLWWLRMTYEHAVRTGRAADWKAPSWPMLDMGGYGSGARFVLDTAIEKDRYDLAEWALAHGADPNSPPPTARALRKTGLYDRAVRENRPAIAELLLRSGADPATAPLDGEEAFVAACLGLDRTAAERWARQFPEYLRSPTAMFAAAARDQPDAIQLLLDLGTPLEVMDEHRQRPLHVAVASDARQSVDALLAHAADVDAPETRWNASPLGYASYHGRTELIDLLAKASTDVFALASHGKVERLRVVLEEEPGRARETLAGFQPLWCLPDDPDAAVEVVKLLLAHGADPTAGPSKRKTAAESARQWGLEEAAALIEAAVARR
jgi:ankyrin repeat protein